MRLFAAWVSSFPRSVLALTAFACALAAAGIVDPATGEMRLRVDPALNRLLPDDAPSRHVYDELIARFGSDDVLVVGLEVNDVFHTASLRRLQEMTRSLEAIEGVHHVWSVTNTPQLRAVEGDLEFAPLLAEIPDDPAALRRAQKRVLADPIHGGNLVSRDGRVAALFVHLDSLPEQEWIARGLDLEILRTAERHAGEGRVWMAGTPFVKAEMSRILLADLSRMVPAVVVLMLVVCGFAFRAWVASVVPVTTVLAALLWTLGIITWTGRTLDVITSLVPVLVLVVGFAYVVHVVAAHRDALRAGRVGREAARSALEHVGFPVVLTALTTAAGFLSLMAHPLPVIREFGLLCAVGVASSLVASLTLAPALLALAHARAPTSDAGWERRFDHSIQTLGAFDLRHRRAIVACGVLLLTGALLASTRLEVNTQVIENFAPGSPVRAGFEAINTRLEGANSLYVMVQAPARGGLLEPDALREIDSLQRWLEEQPEVGGTTSAVDHLAAIHRAFRGDGPGVSRIPATRRMTAQLFLVGRGDELDKFVDGRYRTATIVVRSTATESKTVGALARRIEARLETLGQGLTGRLTGNGVLLARTADDISRGQATSLAWAFGAIFAILAVYFRSLRLGALALVPNLLPVAVYFGVMSATRVTLNNATALMGCMVLGIAVDDTVHFLVQFRRLARRGEHPDRAAEAALRHVARPVTWTTLVLCMGLLVVTTSELATQAQFGALGAFTLGFAWLVDLVLTPALCSLMPRQSGWRSRTTTGISRSVRAW